MTVEKFKEMVAKIPDKHGKLEVECFTIDDDFEYQQVEPIMDDLTFYKWQHEKDNMIETISLLFFKGYKNYGL